MSTRDLHHIDRVARPTAGGYSSNTLELVFWVWLGLLFFAPETSTRVGGVPVETIILACAAPFVLWRARAGVISRAARSSLALLMAISTTLVVATALKGDWTGSVRAVTWLLAGLFAVQMLKTEGPRKRLAFGLAFSALIVSIISVAAYGLKTPEQIDILNFSSRNTLAYFMVMGVAAFAALAKTSRGGAMHFLGALWLAAIIILSGSRGAALAMAAGLLISSPLLMRGGKTGLLGIIGAAAALLCALGGVVASDSSVQQRLASVVSMEQRGSSNFYRATMYEATLRAAPELALMGASPGTEGAILYRSMQNKFVFDPNFNTDSDYIAFMIIGGVLPTLLLAIFTLSVLRRAIDVASHATESRDLLLFTMICPLLVVQTFFDNLLTNQLGWAIVGMIVALSSAAAPARGRHW